MTTATHDPKITFSNMSKYTNAYKLSINFGISAIEDIPVQIFYAKQGENNFTEENSIKATLYTGERVLSPELPKGTYDKIRIDIGERAGLTYRIDSMDIIADNGVNHDDVIRVHIEENENESGIKELQYSTDKVTWRQADNVTFDWHVYITYGSAINAKYYYRLIDNVGNISEPTEAVVIKKTD